MKFSCYKSDMVKALTVAIKAVAVKPQTPIHSGIYLRAEGGQLELQANNLSLNIATKIPVNCEWAGAAVVSGKRFAEFVRNMPDETITFTEDGNTLKIESGGATVDLFTFNADDFPKMPVNHCENSFRVLDSILRNLIRQTIFAVSKETDRPFFTSVLFEIKGNEIICAATNTHRFAWAKGTLPESYPDARFVVSADALLSILDKLNPKSDSDYVKVDYSAHNVIFSFYNCVVSARRIAGEFPAYEKVMNVEGRVRAEVDTKEFKTAISFVSLMSKETQYKTVNLNFEDDGVEISFNSPEIGGAVKNIEAAVEGEGFSVAFDVRYLVDYLRAVDAPKLSIRADNKFKPMEMKEAGNDDFIYIVTPVRR